MPLRGIINALASYSLGSGGGSRDSNLSSTLYNENYAPAVKIQRLARADFQASRVYAEQGPLAVLTRNTRRIINNTNLVNVASITSEESNNSADESGAAVAGPAKGKRSIKRSSSMKVATASNTCAEKQEWLLVLHENLLTDPSSVVTGADHMLCLMREQTTASATTVADSSNSSASLSTSETAAYPVIVSNEARSLTGERFVQTMARLNEHLKIFQAVSKQSAFALNEAALRGLCESVAQHPQWSPMHVAAYQGWLEAVRAPDLVQYLNEPATVPSEGGFNGHGELPVMLAIQQAHVEVVQALLESGARIDIIDVDGNTAFHYAARSQQPIMVEIVACAVKQREQSNGYADNLVSCPNVHGHTALYVAARGKRATKSRLLCEALMRAGASTSNNLTTSTGTHSHSSVVELGQLLCKMFPDLLDVNAARNGGCVYHWARSRDAVLRFIDLGIPLYDAEQHGKVKIVNDFGETPLFCAVKTNRLDVCITLLSNGAVVNARDRDGLTPLHVAVGCVTRHVSHNVVRCLIAFGADVSLKAVAAGVVDGSHNGKTPVDMARLIESEHARNEVLLIMSVGRNAHKCAHFDDAELFVDKIRIEDMPGHSSNDMHLEYDYIERLMCKFSGRRSSAVSTTADDMPRPHSTKYMAPHKPQHPHSPTKTLVNSVATRLRGKLRGGSATSSSPSVGADSNSGKLSPPHDGVLPAGSSERIEMDLNHSGGRLEAVLSLDGGGIKGINHVLFLMELEECVGISVVDLFDWIAGTSTGGILAIMLARGSSLRQCLMTYLQVKDRVFRGKRPYSAQALELVLEEKIGYDTRMSELRRPKLLIPACVADRHPPGVHFFSNLTNWTAYEQLVPRAETKKGRLNTLRQQLPPEQQMAWKAARSTGAAPTYFNSFEAYVDGGLVANNPTLDALAEILEYNHIQLTAGPAVLSSLSAELLNTVNKQQKSEEPVDGIRKKPERSTTEQSADVLKPKKQREPPGPPEKVKLCCVVSLGCGKGPVAALEGIDLCRPETLWDVNTLATLAGNMNTMTRMIIEQATSTDGRQVSRARAWCRSLKVPYYRFTPRLSQHIALDCTDDERLIQMMWETRVYLKKQHRNIDQLARLLRATHNSKAM